MSPDLKSRSFLTDDPALIVLYAQLRQKTLQTLRGASKITPRVEWEFILHNARLYARMGCDILGLDLGEHLFQEMRLLQGNLTDTDVCSPQLGVPARRHNHKTRPRRRD